MFKPRALPSSDSESQMGGDNNPDLSKVSQLRALFEKKSASPASQTTSFDKRNHENLQQKKQGSVQNSDIRDDEPPIDQERLKFQEQKEVETISKLATEKSVPIKPKDFFELFDKTLSTQFSFSKLFTPSLETREDKIRFLLKSTEQFITSQKEIYCNTHDGSYSEADFKVYLYLSLSSAGCDLKKGYANQVFSPIKEYIDDPDHLIPQDQKNAFNLFYAAVTFFESLTTSQIKERDKRETMNPQKGSLSPTRTSGPQKQIPGMVINSCPGVGH